MTKIPLVLLVVLCALVTTAAAIARPVWDDAWLTLMMTEGADIRPFMADRPLLGQIWQWTIETGAFWQISYAIHFVGTLAMAGVTAMLWSTIFPGLRSHAPIVAALAVAPVIAETQLLIVNSMLGLQLQVVLVFGAAIIAIRTAETPVNVSRHRLATLGAVAVVLLTSQISEYAVTATLSVAVLSAGLWMTRGARWSRSALLTGGSLFGAAVIGYGIYWLMADAVARQTVRPEAALGGSILRKLQTVTVRMANELWAVTVGQLGRSASRVDIDPTYTGVGLFVLAIVAAALVAWAIAKRSDVNSSDREHLNTRTAAVLLGALAAGLLPVVVMNRSGAVGGMATRFWLPILPVAACTTYFIILTTLGNRRRAIAASFASFLVVYSTASLVNQAGDSSQRTAAWGDALRNELLPTGLNVAVFVSSEPGWDRIADYELTARLTRGWSAEERRRFWAFPTFDEILPMEGERMWGDVFPPRSINRMVRGLGRSGDVARFILVAVDRRGRARIQHHDASELRTTSGNRPDVPHQP